MRDPRNEEVVAPTGLTAFACQDYAGAFACAAKQEGFTIRGKVEQDDDFGMAAWMHNQSWLAPHLAVQRSSVATEWPREKVDVVFGNPPCSGFSVLTASSKWQERGQHGAEAMQNRCMVDLIDHGINCQAEVIVFESVQAASTTGRSLMIELHNRLEDRTRKTWHLTLVLMNALSVGGWPDRRRFFFVASRKGPVDMPVATSWAQPLSAAIGDLIDHVDDDPLSPYSTVRTPKALRHAALAASGYWEMGEPCDVAYDRAVAAGWDGPVPDRSDRIRSMFTSARWHWERPARVATATVLDTAVHPIRSRTLTHAEVGRIMGFPGQYDLVGITKQRGKGRALYGKGIPAQSGRWLMEGIRRHLTNETHKDDLQPMEFDGTGLRWTLNVTDSWRRNRPPSGEQLELAL
jgi:site-specific DNA-cytosine methylase